MATAKQTKIQTAPNPFHIHSQTTSSVQLTSPSTKLPRLAVLIDAENAPAGIIRGLFNEIAQYGMAYVRRAYADWTHLQNGWREVFQTYAIKPIQQSPYVAGKSVTDMAMIIDAMDLLYSRKLDAFCLVSSDSDFACLATRIQDEGLPVLGFGEEKSPKSYMQTFDRFHIWQGGLDFQVRLPYWQGDTQLIQDVQGAITQAKQKDGWANMSRLGSVLRNKPFSIAPEQHGYSGFRNLFQDIGAFEFADRNGSGLFVRGKNAGQNGSGPA